MFNNTKFVVSFRAVGCERPTNRDVIGVKCLNDNDNNDGSNNKDDKRSDDVDFNAMTLILEVVNH